MVMYGYLNLEMGSVSEYISQASVGLAGSAENAVLIFKFGNRF